MNNSNHISITTALGISNIYIGESIRNLNKYLPGKGRVIIITDSNVFEYYGEYMSEWPVIIIKPGESHKTLETLGYIYTKLIELNADRHSFIVGIGGGIVTDVTGMVAATWMRGVSFGFISTTLLAQVDASVGGKNGININGYKNMAGTFLQPKWVLCDIQSLSTLNNTEYLQGFSEIIKIAAILDKNLFKYIEENAGKALERDPEVLSHIIHRAVELKAGVVQRDEKESGERRILNFGHSFAHVIEKLTHKTHGEAVAAGMVMAAGLSVNMGLISAEETERLVNIIKKFGLPVSVPIPAEEMASTMVTDKKMENGTLSLVLLNKIGQSVIYPVPATELSTMLKKIIQL